MRSVLAALALVALAVATPRPQGVTESITPDTDAPEGCSPDYDGTFTISQVNISGSSSKRSIVPRDNTLVMELHDGVLIDSMGRTGYIADNSQFQFDKPPQTGAIYTAGFSMCSNGSLALGNDAIFYSCLSGRFYNLYDTNESEQCFQVFLMTAGDGESSDGSETTASSDATMTSAAGYPDASESMTAEATSAASAGSEECTEYEDGQPQCSTVAAAPSQECSEIGDGQPQCSTAATTPMPMPAATGCSQIDDGQPQCGTSAPSATYTGPTIAHGAASLLDIQREMLGLAAGVMLAMIL